MNHPQSPIPTPAITEELLQELRRLLEAATPGPWLFNKDARGGEEDPSVTFEHESLGTTPVFCDPPFWVMGDGRLIVALRNAAPALLAAAARLKETEARCEALRKACARHFVSLGTRWHSCNLCFHEWSAADPDEKHAPDCLARPLPESQR